MKTGNKKEIQMKEFRTREEYLKELHLCLGNLSEDLRNEILMEFKGIIEDKVSQNLQMTEEEILRSFEDPYIIAQKYEEELGKEKKEGEKDFFKPMLKDFLNSLSFKFFNEYSFSRGEEKEYNLDIFLDKDIKKININILNIDIKLYQSEEASFVLLSDSEPQDFLFWEKKGEVLYLRQESKNHDGTLFLKVPSFLDLFCEGKSSDIFVEEREGVLEIETASGDIEVQKIKNKIKLNSKSGDIHASEIQGNIQMRSFSGDLSLKKGEGVAVLYTASGDILVEENKGDLFLESKSGDLELLDVSFCDVEGKSISGDISLKSQFPMKNIKLNTVSGDVEVKYSQEFCWEVKTLTISGDIIFKKSSLSSLLKDFLRMDLKTISGDILIEKYL